MNNPYTASNTSMDGSMPQHAGQTYEPEIFTLHGRLGRIRYLVYGVSINSVSLLAWGGLAEVLLALDVRNNPLIFSLLLILLYISMFAFTFIVTKRRLNDFDQSGWLGLLLIVPVVNVFFGLYLLFAPGTRGPNRYGAEPCANSPALVVVAWIILIGSIICAGILAVAAIPAYRDYTARSKFAEVVRAANDVKIAVEDCAMERAVLGITGCAGGNNGVPPDLTSPKGMVASLTTTDYGVITATAINGKGLHGQTYILIPTFNNGHVRWSEEGTCQSVSPKVC